MSREARRRTIVFAERSAGLADVDWTCEKAIGLLLRRAGELERAMQVAVIGVNAEGDRATATVRFGGREGGLSSIPFKEDGKWKLGDAPWGRLTMRRKVAAGSSAIALALGLGACGGDGDGQSPNVPEGAVAVVGDAEITEAQLDDATAALRRAQNDPGRAAGRLPAEVADRADIRAQLRRQALSGLLLAKAAEQEAASRGIEVSLGEARQRWRGITRDQFPTGKALRKFLGGRAERDVVKQLQLQMLFEEVNAQIVEEAGGGREGSAAVRRFQDEFRKQWQSQTTCRQGLDASGCPKQTRDD